MEKSSSFMMKNILSQAGHIAPMMQDTAEHCNTLMVMQQMKLAYDWFERYHASQSNANVHTPTSTESHQAKTMARDTVEWIAADPSARPLHSTPLEMHTPSSQSTFNTNESRSLSSSTLEMEDTRAFSVCDHSCSREVPRYTAFRPFATTHRADFYRRGIVSRGRKRLLLHRIINLMVPRFHPFTPKDTLLFNAPDCPQATMPLLQPRSASQLLVQPTALHSFSYAVGSANNNFNPQRSFATDSCGKTQPLPLEKNAQTALESVDGKVEKRRKRTTFTQDQLNMLEHEFQNKKYLTLDERTAIAQTLGLSQVQVKIWWQNRRASYKRSKICQIASNNPEDASSNNSEKQMSAFSGSDGRSKIVVPIPVHVSRRFIGQHGSTIIPLASAKTAPYVTYCA